MPQYSNPLDALRKAQVIGPSIARTPYERQVARFRSPSVRSDYGSDRFLNPDLENVLPAPPQPDVNAAFPTPGPGMNRRADAIISQTNANEAASNAPMAGLQSAGMQMPPKPPAFTAPRVQAGAPSPTEAMNIFKGSAEPQGPPPMALSELFRLAGRSPEETAPGAGAYWSNEIQDRLESEDFQRKQEQAVQTAQMGAQMGGYQSPAEAAAAERQMEMYKLGGPERVAGIQSAADLEKARLTGEYGLAGIESKGAQTQNFLDMLNQSRMSGADVSHLTIPGGGGVSFRQEQQIPTPLLTQVTAARNAYESAKKTSWFTEPTQQKSVYDLAVSQALGAAPISMGSKQELIQMLTSPDLMNEPLGNLDLSDFSPEQQQEITETLLKVRGF